MEIIFGLGMKITALLFGGLWLGFVSMQAIYATKLWINDKEQNIWKPLRYITNKFDKGKMPFGFVAAFSGMFIVLGTFVWPIMYPVLFVCICLFGLRKAVRFKKKIRKLLDDKSDKGHSHPEENEKI